MKTHDIKIKRIYDESVRGDGFRVLVDRLWPRGLSKSEVDIDLWMKEIAPSNELRIWFGHDPENWVEFQKRYRNELKDKKDLTEFLLNKTKTKAVTLLYAAKDLKHNHAVVLKKALQEYKI